MIAAGCIIAAIAVLFAAALCNAGGKYDARSERIFERDSRRCP